MIFWHTGGGLVLARILFGRRLDFRFVALGALLPDLLDKPIGRILMKERFESGRIYGHTLVAIAAATAIGMRRPRAAALAAGMTTHLMLDAIWTEPEVALWPSLGRFPRKPVSGAWWRSFVPGLTDQKLFEEMAGLAALLWLFRREGLASPDRMQAFWHDGFLIR